MTPANTRKYYEKKFASYPDVVDLPTLRKMLGGIGDSFARRLVRENKVQSFFIKPSYQYKDTDFKVGDTVIVAVQRFDMDKKQMYGKILTKW